MIIRKPYAFLIKYFKLIHIGLFVAMTYLLFQTRNIYLFFKNYLLTGTYQYMENIVNSYITMPMFIASILLIASLISIFFLMRQKKKPVFYYLSAIIFYILVFIGLFYFYFIFKSLETTSYSSKILVIFRDIWMILYYLNYYYLIISFIRGFGFNIKKFNFQKDIKELDISEEDREEIEIGVSVDPDKILNYLRKRRRHLKYYFKENRYILTVLAMVFIGIICIIIGIDTLIINKTYQEGSEVIIDDISYSVNTSYLTNSDKYGVSGADYFVIVDLSFVNQSTENKKIAIENTRLNIEDKYYYPTTKVNQKFSDIGLLYKNQTINPTGENNYIVVFQVDKESSKKTKKAILEIYSHTNQNNGNRFYEKVNLNILEFENKEIGDYQLEEIVDLRDTYLKTGTLTINKYEILDDFSYQYTKCDDLIDNGKCIDYQASILPSISKKLLKLEIGGDFPLNLFTDYMQIEYELEGISKIIKNIEIVNKTPENYDSSAVFLEIDKNLVLSSKINLIFNIRNTTFTYRLK